jgi:hypothetical protein
MIRGATENAITTAALTGTDSLSDWYRLRLVIDFTDLGGDGSGSLYVMNLTDGETDFRITPVLSSINLEINAMEAASQDPATWNSLYVRGGSPSQIDNLDPNFVPPVPEPATIVLLAGLIPLVAARRRVGRRFVSETECG